MRTQVFHKGTESPPVEGALAPGDHADIVGDLIQCRARRAGTHPPGGARIFALFIALAIYPSFLGLAFWRALASSMACSPRTLLPVSSRIME